MLYSLSNARNALKALFVLVAFTVFDGHASAYSSQEFLINKSNFSMDGIFELLSKESKKNSQITVDCVGSWRIMWPEIVRKNPWAMLAYAVDFKAPVQNQGRFRKLSTFERAATNRKNIVSSMYYLNFKNKKLLREIEESFDMREGYSTRIQRISEYSGFKDKKYFVSFAKCIVNSKTQSMADGCLNDASLREGVMKFHDFIQYIDETHIRSANDIECVR